MEPTYLSQEELMQELPYGGGNRYSNRPSQNQNKTMYTTQQMATTASGGSKSVPKIGMSRSGATLIPKDPSQSYLRDSYTDTIIDGGQGLSTVIQGKTLSILPSAEKP